MQNSIIAFIRKAKDPSDYLVFICNFTPTPHPAYRLGLPELIEYREIFNSDSELFGGSNMGNGGRVVAEAVPSHGRQASAQIVIPPLAVIALKPVRK
jgi:1,4-alpha-glucan branching enzyme